MKDDKREGSKEGWGVGEGKKGGDQAKRERRKEIGSKCRGVKKGRIHLEEERKKASKEVTKKARNQARKEEGGVWEKERK